MMNPVTWCLLLVNVTITFLKKTFSKLVFHFLSSMAKWISLHYVSFLQPTLGFYVLKSSPLILGGVGSYFYVSFLDL